MTNTEVVPNLEVHDIRIAKIGTCPSISGLSDLTFHIGYEVGNPQCIHLRLVKNSSTGKIHPGWLALADLEQALASVPADGAFKASVLAPLFRGRSTNNLHFSIAVLLHCGLLKKAEPPAEGYVRSVPDVLWKELNALIARNVDLPVPAMGPSAASKEVAPTKPAKSSKKTAAPATA
jgi:hypothetical protein